MKNKIRSTEKLAMKEGKIFNNKRTSKNPKTFVVGVLLNRRK